MYEAQPIWRNWHNKFDIGTNWDSWEDEAVE